MHSNRPTCLEDMTFGQLFTFGCKHGFCPKVRQCIFNRIF